jgi:polysaccharide pyruvyl transferase WcaK-like protein
MTTPLTRGRPVDANRRRALDAAPAVDERRPVDAAPDVDERRAAVAPPAGGDVTERAVSDGAAADLEASPPVDALAPAVPRRQPARVDAHVLLAGAFGQGNPGDEALLDAFVAALPGAAVTATSSAPAATAREHGIAAVERHDAVAMFRAVRAVDAVVFAGGTIFKRLHPSSGRRPLALLVRAAALAIGLKVMRRPLALVGVGAGDLEGAPARLLARVIVRAADLLILRDEESAARLAAAGAPSPMRVGGDAAWALVLPQDRSDERAGPDAGKTLALPRKRDGPVVVALSHLAGGNDLPDRLAAALDPLARAGVPLALQPWDRSGADEALARAVAERLTDAEQSSQGIASRYGGRGSVVVLPPPHDLAAACAGFADARLVVGLRFHSLVAAAGAGTPFLAFVHEPKLAAAARRLGQPRVYAHAPPAAAPDAVARERDRADAAFRLLRVLLAGGRSEEADALDGLDLRPEQWL